MYSFSYLEPVCCSMSSSNCCFLTCIQISRGRLGGLVFPSLSEFSTFCCDRTVKDVGIVNKAEVRVFLELSCFFDDPVDVGNLISASSAFSKSSLNIWKFLVHVLLKPWLANFEHYFASLWDQCYCVVVWTFFTITFFGIRLKTNLFQPCGHCWVFQICWHIECSTFRASSLRVWNSSTVIPSSPLALFVVMLPKARLTSYSRMSGPRWSDHTIMVIWVMNIFFVQFLCVFLHLFLVFSASVRSIPFLSFTVPIFAYL